MKRPIAFLNTVLIKIPGFEVPLELSEVYRNTFLHLHSLDIGNHQLFSLFVHD
jgi:hypothetical protein